MVVLCIFENSFSKYTAFYMGKNYQLTKQVGKKAYDGYYVLANVLILHTPDPMRVS